MQHFKFAHLLVPIFPIIAHTAVLSHAQSVSPAESQSPLPIDTTAFYSMTDSLAGSEQITLGFQNLPASTDVAYTISDYSSATINQGSAKSTTDGRITIALSLPTGFYEIALSASSAPAETFSFLRLQPPPAITNDNPLAPFFSLDAGLSWHGPSERRAQLVANMRHVINGGLARERLSWGGIHPSLQRREWVTRRDFEGVRQLYDTHGIKILEMFHDSPSWLKHAQGGKFPRNLPAADQSFRGITAQWQRYWGAVEIWNEPEIGFGAHQPADQYLPLVKTLRHSIRAEACALPIVGGVLSSYHPTYLDQSARNGLLDEIDVFSFHYYGDPLGIEEQVAKFRAWLRINHHESKPIWLTEIGQRWNGRPDTEAAVASGFAMNATESRACGIAAWFPFFYPHYVERDTHFGMTDVRGLPRRSLAATAQAARALANTRYVGDLKLPGETGVKRARVFATSDKAIMLLVAYTGIANPKAQVTLPFPVTLAQGVDGRNLAPSTQPAHQLPIPDGLVYAFSATEDILPHLQTDTEAMRLTQAAQLPAPTLPPPSPIILQPVLDLKGARISATTRGYHLPAGITQIPLTVSINNLSDESHTVTLKHPSTIAGRTDSSDTQHTVTVAPHSAEDIPIFVTPSALQPTDDGSLVLNLSATAPGIPRIAPASMDFIPSRGLNEYFAMYPYRFALPFGERYRWEENSNGKVVFGYDSPDAIWGIKITFRRGDRWAYPRFNPPQEVDKDRVIAVLLRARCAVPKTRVRLMSWDENGKMSYTAPSVIPSDGEWHVACIPLDSWIDSDGAPIGRKIHKISLGMNSPAQENAIEVSDIYFVGQ